VPEDGLNQRERSIRRVLDPSRPGPNSQNGRPRKTRLRSAVSHNLFKPCPGPARWSGSRRKEEGLNNQVVPVKSPVDPPPCPECCRNPRSLCRGTRSSNPSPSSGESCELRYRHRRPACLFGCGGRQVNMVVAGTERRYALAKENPMELSRIIASGTIGHSLAGGELSAISLIRLTNGPNRRFGIGTPSASRCRHPSDIDRVRTVQARNP
jgi:hypothetical protein